MENNKQVKAIFDIITLVLFLAAFGVAFVFGFILKQADGETPRLATDMLCIIMVIGFGAVYAMGTGSAFYARWKRGLLTKEFSILSGLTTSAFLGIIWIVLVLCVPAFKEAITAGVDSLAIQIVFVICMLLLIAGYGEAVFITEPLTKVADGEEDGEEETEEEEEE